MSSNRNRKITIQTMDQSESWADLVTLWASANGQFGPEYAAGGTEQARVGVYFAVNYSAALSNLDPRTTRILFDGNFYDVQSFDDFKFRHEKLKIRTVRRYGR